MALATIGHPIELVLALFALALALAGEAGRARDDGPDAAAGPLLFGLIADAHYADRDTVGERYFRSSLAKLEECVADLARRDLAFTVQLGDLIDGDFESFSRILPVIDRLRMPKYHVLGNHDFPAPREEVLSKLGLETPYYSFALGGWRFVVLDSVDIAVDGGWPEKSENDRQAVQWVERLESGGRPNAETWNGAVGERQEHWVSGVLDEASARGERAIVFSHIPLAAPAGGERHLLYNHGEIAELLESSGCVAACLSGHDHNGGYVQRNGVHYVTLQGMVETADENAYAIVGLQRDRVEIHGVGRAPSRVLCVPARRADPNTTGG